MKVIFLFTKSCNFLLKKGRNMKTIIGMVAISGILLLTGCGSSYSNNNKADDANAGIDTTNELNKSQKLGKLLFFDKNLSKTRNTNCATCHDPDHAFIDARYQGADVNQTIFVNGAFSVGDDGISLGGRNSPTAAYAMFSPEFGEKDGVYSGGQFHDGRAATLKIQAMGPPLDGAEMMMPDKALVVSRIEENTEYVSEFKAIYGDDIFKDTNKTFDKMAEAIADFERTKEFAPFDSKFDRWVEGKVELTALEKKGFDLFNSDKTNCRLCHTLNSSSISVDKTGKNREMFTNYEYENIGSPRNISAMDRRAALGLQDKDATFKGLGGLLDNETHNGKSRVPTLRNIAVTDPYMSNGTFQKLRTTVEFYDFMSGKGIHNTNPETGKAWGKNDFPATVNHERLGETETLSVADVDALVSFLRTLTDKKYEPLMRKFTPKAK
jgi:cytochrome c peroxidase